MARTNIPAALRRLVRERAGNRCEYCLFPERLCFAVHWIDHIVAEKHGGVTDALNLALTCALCNRWKGTDLASVDPLTDEIVLLFHPRLDCWSDHFRVDGNRIEPLTSVGRATARLLRFNCSARLAERDLCLQAGELLPPTQ